VDADVIEYCAFEDPANPNNLARISNVVLTTVESRDNDEKAPRKFTEALEKALLEYRKLHRARP